MNSALIALSLVTQFHCISLDGLRIFAEVEFINQENFNIKLHNDYMEMPVHQKRIGIDKLGELNEVEASAWWELFHIKRIEGRWQGEYWNDNARSELSCITKG